MPVWTDPLKYYDSFTDRLDRLGVDASTAYRLLPEGAKDDKEELTSGSVSSKTLRAMGHPYARAIVSAGGNPKPNPQRRGVSKRFAQANNLKGKAIRAAAPLLPINRQSGRLARSIKIVRRRSKDGQTWHVSFDRSIAGKSIYAVLPRGTRRVVPRGLWTETKKRWRVRNRAFRDVFVRRQRAVMSKP